MQKWKVVSGTDAASTDSENRKYLRIPNAGFEGSRFESATPPVECSISLRRK